MRRDLLTATLSAALTLGVATAFVVCPQPAAAHTGGALDVDGCHADHRRGMYHCHRGEAAGYTFADRTAMLEAVRTGKFPEKTVDEEGFFSRLWPWGKTHEQQSADAPADGSAPAAAAPAAPGAAPTGPPLSAKEREIQEKLKILQGLYEMGLITKEEYEGRRRTILEQI